MNMYKVTFTDPEGVSIAIKILATNPYEAEMKAKEKREGNGFKAFWVRDDDEYASIKL